MSRKIQESADHGKVGDGLSRSMPPALDRELAAPLQAILDELPTPLTAELIPDRRERTALASLSDNEIRRDGAFDLQEKVVPGLDGAPYIPVLLCIPTGTPSPHAVIYHIHGGGMVAGNNRSPELADELRRAQVLQLAVAAVNYRLAPENPDPAPVNDCFAGLEWLARSAPALGLNRDRIIISGNSAGGALAAGVALLTRDRGGPRLLGQMLQSPMLDDRCDTWSAIQMKQTGLWDGLSNLAGWSALLGERRGTDSVSCYAAPGRAVDLSGLPPAFIDVGSVEALRDEAARYVTRIWEAGGDAELHIWSGAFHSFSQWVPEAKISRIAESTRIAWLRRLLDK